MVNLLVTWLVLSLVLGIGAGALLWWLNRIREGAPVRPWLLGLFAVGSFVLFFLVERPEWVVLGGGTTLIDLVALTLVAVLAGRFTIRRAELRRDADGRWTSRVGFTLPVLWLLLLILRLLVEVTALPRVSLFGTPVVGSFRLDPSIASALLLVGILFAMSTGLLLGQYSGIYYRYRALRAAPPVPAGAV
ncbi:MAG TPA: hypothetical protein VJS68_03565 [Thermoplasmata archaeon]|nr:hypothetical protein [Thermoplasmata archaeon]